MSVRTEIDSFSGHVFWPGHGRFHVRKDGSQASFRDMKSFRLDERKRNPRDIAWTEFYRRDHKKIKNVEQRDGKRTQRAKKVKLGFQGSTASGARADVSNLIKARKVANKKK